MKTILIVAALASAPALASAEDVDVMASRFGNTTIAHTESGHEVHMYYKPDHTFTGKVVDVGFDLKGTWAVNGTDLCLTYDPAPPTVTNPQCQPIAPHKVGDSWTAGGRTITIVAGVQ
ncbi:MAG TPA: hypothetical protein VGM17_05940 [Rhizomicrobium sp.]|jgi:hypothetical protein